MPISFANIPANIKVPLYWVEVDPSMAGLPTINLRALLVGVMIADGNAPFDIPRPIGSQAQADEAFGQGSELSRMFKAYFANNFANEVWGLPLKEATAATAGTATITVTAAPTSAGTLHLYIAGEHIPVNVATTDTVTTIAAAIVAAINDEVALPVTAANAAGVVTLTSVFKSINANEITVSLNYYGSRGGEQTPPGLGITMPATGFLTGGTGSPDFDAAIINLGEEPYEYVAMPYTDSNSLFDWDQEYGFTDMGRWGWQRQLFGHVFSAKRGTYAELITFGDALNSPVESVMAVEKASPSPTFEWAAAYAAKAQRALINDPARPLQALTLNQIKGAGVHQRFDFVELNSLASTGLAIQKVGADNQPMIAREQTTYQVNLYGQPDDAYELVTTLATLAKLLRNQKHAITSKYPRHKLANDGTKFGPGQAIVTPGIAKAELIAQYQQDMYVGLVEDLSNFKRHLLVERDPNDPNRLNVLYPPDLINQLRIFAVLAQFRLQYDRGIDTQIIGPTSPPFNAASGA
ncbi:phage tail sheath C-terminal domain-containing protein [Bradyrhizobium sp. 170]|uniref:phage tail sheath C-terminal domain-containing protein n=1 Tax=Bradyrhizobium sp. 170 TaxID=2782641 RepID=UPI001FFF2C9C|nr:phage tail sheath C-terminal domain-containing protein [Bradyrhizobium sp. 170]UPK03104.1 phage tail protein [Bradyrhizobium sp. 170]